MPRRNENARRRNGDVGGPLHAHRWTPPTPTSIERERAGNLARDARQKAAQEHAADARRNRLSEQLGAAALGEVVVLPTNGEGAHVPTARVEEQLGEAALALEREQLLLDLYGESI